MPSPIALPMTSSALAAAQPPCSNPPRGSSSAPAGACITPSSVTWLVTMSSITVSLRRVAPKLGVDASEPGATRGSVVGDGATDLRRPLRRRARARRDRRALGAARRARAPARAQALQRAAPRPRRGQPERPRPAPARARGRRHRAPAPAGAAGGLVGLRAHRGGRCARAGPRGARALGAQPADDERGRAERGRPRAGPRDDLRPGRRGRPRGVARPAGGRRPARGDGGGWTALRHARAREGSGRHVADRRADPARARLPQAAPGRCGGRRAPSRSTATARRRSACSTPSRRPTRRAGAPRAPRGSAGAPCTSR